MKLDKVIGHVVFSHELSLIKVRLWLCTSMIYSNMGEPPSPGAFHETTALHESLGVSTLTSSTSDGGIFVSISPSLEKGPAPHKFLARTLKLYT